MGPEDSQRIVFDGLVSAIEVVLGDSEPPRVVVLAEDRLMRLRMTRRMRTYHRVDRRRRRPADRLRARPPRRGHRATGRATTCAAGQPERPGLPARAGPAAAGRAVVRGADPALQRPVAPPGHPAHPGARQRADHRRGSPPTWPTSAPTSRSAATTPAPRRSSTSTPAPRRSTPRRCPGAPAPRCWRRRSGRAPASGCGRPRSTAAEASAWAKAEMLRRARRFVTVSGHDPRLAGPGGRQPAAARAGRRALRGRRLLRHPGDATPSTTSSGLRTAFEAERPTSTRLA